MISLNWVHDYVPVKDEDPKDLALRITKAGVNVEGIYSHALSHLVIGCIIECSKHPDSDHLHICKVDVKSEILQIVCGAPNVRVGLKVIVALVGAVLPENFVISKSKIRGVESNGMICALYELGLVPKTEELYQKGIEELPSDARVGDDPIAYLGYDDVAYDLDLNPNRFADCTNHIGFAYEVAAVTGKEVTLPSLETHPISESVFDFLDVDVQTDLCPMYLVKMVKNVVIGESPDFIKRRLMTAGMRPINNVVDISNYVMLEYGQPLHFYDASKLGEHLIVREAVEGESLKTLDGNVHVLRSCDIVIANEKEAIGLAGVMGGESTMVDEYTTNLVIESAIFDAYHVRYTSIQHHLRSEASLRFEKPMNPDYCEQAIERACHLLELYASGKVLSGSLFEDHLERIERKAVVTTEEVNQMLGVSMTDRDVMDSLNRLHFPYQKDESCYCVTIPSRRMDVEAHKSDLIEEIGRLYGYDKIQPVLPKLSTKKGEYIGNAKIRKQVSFKLRSLGLQEVRTYLLQSMNDFQLFPYHRGEMVKVDLPMSLDKAVIRQSLLASLLKVVEFNLSHNTKNMAIYEIANTYADEDVEDTKISIALLGDILSNAWNGLKVKADFYVMKGIVEELLDYLGFRNRYHFIVNKELIDMHPGISAEVLLDKKPIGFFGRVHPTICSSEVYVMEISLTKLADLKVKSIKYKEPSKYPEIKKDLAFIVSQEVSSQMLEDVIRTAGGRLLTDIMVFDVYTGENVPAMHKSLAYTLTFADNTRTLSDEEVMKVFQHIIEEVEKQIGAKLRNE